MVHEPIDPPPAEEPEGEEEDGDSNLGPVWLNTLMERLFEGKHLEEIAGTVREVARENATTRRKVIDAQTRVIRMTSLFRFVIVLLALVAFAAGGWVYRSDKETVRLLIVSFVSFLSGAVAVSGGAWAARSAGRKG